MHESEFDPSLNKEDLSIPEEILSYKLPLEEYKPLEEFKYTLSPIEPAWQVPIKLYI